MKGTGLQRRSPPSLRCALCFHSGELEVNGESPERADITPLGHTGTALTRRPADVSNTGLMFDSTRCY